MSDAAERSLQSLTNFYGPNAGYVLELYERFQKDPAAVDPVSRTLFETWGEAPQPPNNDGIGARREGLEARSEGFKSLAGSEASPSARPEPSYPKTDVGGAFPDIAKVVGAARVTRLVRELGHLTAHVDPLGGTPPGDPGLLLETHGLNEDDLRALPASVVGGPLAEDAPDALDALARLRQAYSGPIGYEDDHIQVDEERQWLRQAVESRRFFAGFDDAQKRHVLERLTEVEGFERFLQATFGPTKRFSIEGTDVLVPILDSIIHDAAQAGTREVVMGMAHRGRLNVLTHILGKPYAALLAEFQAAKEAAKEQDAVSGGESGGYSGDVKYHLGARRAYTDDDTTRAMPITLAPNPSHLEFVNPVVVGRARAAQEHRLKPGAPTQDTEAALAIQIHGDAAFPGQGIVAETLNLSHLPGYEVGGSIHIIVNNQIGFTTLPGASRSTLYASDLAKGFEIPIVHVNADDPEACLAAARMAHAYREQFGKDFLIDLIGYRRFGHNEGDEPAFTQPMMYETINSHPTVRALWASELERQNVIQPGDADALVQTIQAKLAKARGAQPGYALNKAASATARKNGTNRVAHVPAARLKALNDALQARPEGFHINPKLERILARRTSGINEPNGIDWAHAESLAFASLLEDGTPIRLTGQDSERGTFGVRHSVLHDPETGARYTPLQALPQARASFAVYNSPLSENAALGFEYGYSMHATGALVLWEAQFGDFSNGAQVIIDQFLVSGNAKWQQTPSLVLLLPHGYEGQGPEHSSGRVERYLQLAANDNIRVVNCTTAAQFFHVLRRQAALIETMPRPLIVMTPKSLLRNPLAASSLSDLADGAFQPVLHTAERASGARHPINLVQRQSVRGLGFLQTLSIGTAHRCCPRGGTVPVPGGGH